MRYPASEKLEIIRLVEESALPVRRTLEKIGIPRATFYRWYDLYEAGGGLERPTSQAGSRLEPHSRRCSRAHHQAGVG
jgi:transposase-like protein